MPLGSGSALCLAPSARRTTSLLTAVIVVGLTGCSSTIATWNPSGDSTSHHDLDRALVLARQRNLTDMQATDRPDNSANAHDAVAFRAASVRRIRQAHYLVREGDVLLAAADPLSLPRSDGHTRPDRLAVDVSARLAEIRSSYASRRPAAAFDAIDRHRASSDPTDMAYLTLSDLGDVTGPATQPSDADARTADDDGVRGPRPGFGETVWRDVRRIHRDLWDDTKRVYTNPTNLVILLTAGGTALALRPEVDDEIEDHYDRHHTLSEGWREAFGVAGNPAFHFALAGGWYLVGQQMQDIRTYEVGKTLFSALIINGVSTATLKLCACTDGPNGESFAWPSGHTSSAFTFAAVMHQSYGHWAGIPLYGLAGMVGLARLDDREHHFSDVVFGAAMGLVIGHTVAGGRRPQLFGGDFIPYADPSRGAGGIAWFRSIK